MTVMDPSPPPPSQQHHAMTHSIPTQKLTTTLDPHAKSLEIVLEMAIKPLTSPPQPLLLQCPPSISIINTTIPHTRITFTKEDIEAWEREIIEKEKYCNDTFMGPGAEGEEDTTTKTLRLVHHPKDISAEISYWQQENRCSSGILGLLSFDIAERWYEEDQQPLLLKITYTITNTDGIFPSPTQIILLPSSPLLEQQCTPWIPHLSGAVLSDWTLEWIITDPSYTIVTIGTDVVDGSGGSAIDDDTKVKSDASIANAATSAANTTTSAKTTRIENTLPSSIAMVASTLYRDAIEIEATTTKVFCPESLQAGMSSLLEWFTKAHNFLEWYLRLNEHNSTANPFPLSLAVVPHSYPGSAFLAGSSNHYHLPGTLPFKGKMNDYQYVSRMHGSLPSAPGLLLLPSTMSNGANLIDDEIPNRRSLSTLMAAQYFGHSVSEASVSGNDLWLLVGIREYLSRQILKPFHGCSEAKLVFKMEMERLIQLEENDSLLGSIALTDVVFMDHWMTSSPSPPSPLSSIPSARKSIPSVCEFFSNPLYKEWFLLKSFLVLKIMESRLEEKDMRRIISCIYDEVVRNNKKLTTSLFLSVAKSVSDRDMRSFGEQWISSGGSPHIECSFVYQRKRSVLQMTLTQMVPHFTKRLSGTFLVRVHEMDGVFDHHVHIDDHQHSFELPIHAKSKKIKRKRRLLMNLDGTSYVDHHQNSHPQFLEGGGGGGQEGQEEEEEEEPKYTNPISWIRLDPDQQWIADLSLQAPEEMWCEQLKHDRDIIAQYEAIQQLHRMIIRNNCLLSPSATALQTHPSLLFEHVSMEAGGGGVELNSIEHILDSLDRVVLDPRIYHVIRSMAAEALVSIAPPRNPEATKEVGALRVVNLYNRQYALPVVGPPSVVPVPRPNDWSSPPQGHSQIEFMSLASSYYLLTQILPTAMSKVCCRSGHGNVLELMGQVLLNQLRYNDNSSNLCSSDSAYVSRLMSSICSHLEARNLVGGMSLDRITKEFVRELDRHLLLERLPCSMSHRNVVMVAVIESWSRLWVLFNAENASATLQISVSSRFFGQLLKANGVSMGASLRGKMLESILMQKDSFIDCRLSALSALLSMLFSYPSEAAGEGELVIRWLAPLLQEDQRRRVRLATVKMLLSHPLLVQHNPLFSSEPLKEWIYCFLKKELTGCDGNVGYSDESFVHLLLLLAQRLFPSDESDCGKLSWRERKTTKVDVVDEEVADGAFGADGGAADSQTIPKLRLTLKPTEQPDWAMEAAAESGLSLDYVYPSTPTVVAADVQMVEEKKVAPPPPTALKLRLNLSQQPLTEPLIESTQPQPQPQPQQPTEEQIRMEKCIQDIWMSPESHPFRYKVDTTLLPLYEQIIKQPMDLQKMKEKLLRREYESFAPLLTDCALIFSNCLTFNQSNSPIALQCKRLRAVALLAFMENRQYLSEDLIKKALDLSAVDDGNDGNDDGNGFGAMDVDHHPSMVQQQQNVRKVLLPIPQKKKKTKKTTPTTPSKSKLPPPPPSLFENIDRKDGEDKRRLLVLLDYIRDNHPFSHWFASPLDPIALGIPTYTDIVTEPMDFSTLKDHLIRAVADSGSSDQSTGALATATVSDELMECLRMFELIFSNCILFNPPNTVVHQNALVIRDDFVQLAQDLFNISSRKVGHKIVFSTCLGVE